MKIQFLFGFRRKIISEHAQDKEKLEGGGIKETKIENKIVSFIDIFINLMKCFLYCIVTVLLINDGSL